MMRIPLLGASTLALALVIHAPASAAPLAAPADGPTIRTVAPVKSFLVAGADDVSGLIEKFQKTPLWAMWKSDTMQSAMGDAIKEFETSRDERMKTLGLPADTLSWPTMAGLALYGEKNEELDVMEPQFVLLADWGEGADKMGAFFDAMVAEQAKKSPESVRSKEFRGHKGSIVRIAGDGKDGDPRRFRMRGGPEELAAGMDSIREVIYVRAGNHFLLTSSESGAEEALAALEAPPAKQIDGEEDFRGARDFLGESDAYAILRTGPMQPLVDEAMGGPLAMIQPMLTQLFGDIQGFAFGLNVDGKLGMVETSAGIYVPGDKVGLLSLPTAATPATAPALVPQDAIGYSRMGVAFKDLMKVVGGVVSNLPEAQAQELEPMLQQYGPVLSKAFDALGPDVHVFTTVTQPVNMESERTTVAVSCSGEQNVLPLINLFGPTLGMEPRDFNGQTIFSGEGVPVSVGFGRGAMIMGPTASVEQALRGTDAEAPQRGPAEKAAMDVIGSSPAICWGWHDTVAGLDVARQQMKLMEAESEGGDGFMEDEQKAIQDAVGVKSPVKYDLLMKAMEPSFSAKYLGPQAWTLRPEPRGFMYRAILLRPAGQ